MAGGRLKADLFGLEAEKAHVRGKTFPLCSLTKHIFGFFAGEIDGRGFDRRT